MRMRTKTIKPKIIIGQYYQRPMKNHMNTDCEFWQSVYLGEYQREVQFSRQMYLYISLIVIIFITLAVFV
jgi:hypothetical protein